MKKILAAAIGAGALVVLGAVAPANAAEAPAKLSVLHGVPGLTVDVYVNNELTLDDFEPGDLAGPLELPAGTYTVAITASDAADASAPAIGPVDLPLESGQGLHRGRAPHRGRRADGHAVHERHLADRARRGPARPCATSPRRPPSTCSPAERQ